MADDQDKKTEISGDANECAPNERAAGERASSARVPVEHVQGDWHPERKDRLNRELRDNLKRRKGQSRSRGEEALPGVVSRSARKTLINPD